MSSAILSPQGLTRSDLDDYLAKGWRPFGQRIYTANFIQVELGEIYSVVPTRLPLSTHQWRKGQRKLLRKNGQAFRTTIGPAVLNREKIRVNERYLLEHPKKSIPELNIHLEHEGRKIFSTLECSIYHGDKLIAFSFFDVGEASVYSKAGIYDPDYQAFSLGLYSMYLEIEWCAEKGLEYYYPGYISPDTPLFDYKTKIGQLEFWNLHLRKWLPLKAFQLQQHGPLAVLLSRTQTLNDALYENGLSAKRYKYVFFEMKMTHAGPYALLDSPCFLLLNCPAPQQCWIAYYNLDLGCYECWLCFFDRMVTFFDQTRSFQQLFRYVLQMNQCLFQAPDTDVFVRHFKKLLADKAQALVLKEI
jgi:arginyl-tRNA--protein-N-Asp/Glu arginylyltransferase